MKYVNVFTFLTILIVGTGCNGQVKKDLPKETEHPKLIKTIGNPGYGNVQCSIQDKAGNLWFGTTENGLYKYDGKSLPTGQARFNQFLVADGLNSNNIWSILEDKDGKIWIGTDAGLCLYDPSDTLMTGGKMFAKIQIPLPKNLPPNRNRNTHEVFSMMQDKSGKLWFATIDGVFIYDGKSLLDEQAAFTLFTVSEGAGGYMSSNNNAEKILEDKAGNIWFGGRGTHGVYRYDPSAALKTGVKSVINIKLEELSTFRSDSIRTGHDWAWPQLQDKNGNIWFSNWAGVYQYDPSASLRTGPLTSLRTGPESFTSFTASDGLSIGPITRIIEDRNGNLWFGGADGLCRYDPSASLRTGPSASLRTGPSDSLRTGPSASLRKSFTCFKDGLINPWIWSILEDKTGNLWIGTRATGLYLFDGKKFINYSEYKK